MNVTLSASASSSISARRPPYSTLWRGVISFPDVGRTNDEELWVSSVFSVSIDAPHTDPLPHYQFLCISRIAVGSSNVFLFLT